VPADPLPRHEQELRAFLAPLGVDLDGGQGPVCFQLYRTSTDVIAAVRGEGARAARSRTRGSRS